MTTDLEDKLRDALRTRADSTIINSHAYRIRPNNPRRSQRSRASIVIGVAAAIAIAVLSLASMQDTSDRIDVTASTLTDRTTLPVATTATVTTSNQDPPLEKLSTDPAWRERLYQAPTFEGWFLSGNRRVALDSGGPTASRLSVVGPDGAVIWAREIAGNFIGGIAILRVQDNSIILLRRAAEPFVISEIQGDTGEERELVSYVHPLSGAPSRMNVVGDNVVYTYGGPTGTVFIVNFRTGQQRRIDFAGTLILPSPNAPSESPDRRLIAVALERSQPRRATYIAVVDLDNGAATELVEFASTLTSTVDAATRVRFDTVRVAWTTENQFRVVWSDRSEAESTSLQEAAVTFDSGSHQLTVKQFP